MSKLNNQMLNKRVRFYDPHPGLAGAVISIPKLIKRVADSLDGEIMTLREAILKLQAVTDDVIEVLEDYKLITLKIKTPNGTERGFRVIRYKEVKKNPHR